MSICVLAERYGVKGQTLRKQYKEKISDYRNWDQLEQVINPEQRDLFGPPAAKAARPAPVNQDDPAAAPADGVQISAPAPKPAAAAPPPVFAARPRRTNWITGFRP